MPLLCIYTVGQYTMEKLAHLFLDMSRSIPYNVCKCGVVFEYIEYIVYVQHSLWWNCVMKHKKKTYSQRHIGFTMCLNFNSVWVSIHLENFSFCSIYDPTLSHVVLSEIVSHTFRNLITCDILLYSQISTISSHHQRVFLYHRSQQI